MKMLFGVAGIYGAFMYYGVLQEGVTKWQYDYDVPKDLLAQCTSEAGKVDTVCTGQTLGRAWFLNTLEVRSGLSCFGLGPPIPEPAHPFALSLRLTLS